MLHRRVVHIYRLCDVSYLGNYIEIPERYKELLRGPFSIWVDEKALISNPLFWRVVGLILGDKHGEKERYNAFTSTHKKLALFAISCACILFSAEAVSFSEAKTGGRAKNVYR